MREQEQNRTHLLDFNLFIASDRLVINVGYSAGLHRPETISSVLDKFTQNIADFSAVLDGGQMPDIESDLDLSLLDLNESDFIQLEKLLNA